VLTSAMAVAVSVVAGVVLDGAVLDGAVLDGLDGAGLDGVVLDGAGLGGGEGLIVPTIGLGVGDGLGLELGLGVGLGLGLTAAGCSQTKVGVLAGCWTLIAVTESRMLPPAKPAVTCLIRIRDVLAPTASSYPLIAVLCLAWWFDFAPGARPRLMSPGTSPA
jgi:hypothetical protein